MKKTTLSLEGMHCASCVAKIEKALKNIPGARKATVNFATEKAYVEHDDGIAFSALQRAVEKAGYRVRPSTGSSPGRKHTILSVMGMGSAHCEGIVSSSLKRLKGVFSVSTNLTQRTATIEHASSVSFQELIDTVKRAGYDAALKQEKEKDTDWQHREAHTWRLKTIFAVIFTLPVLYLTMGHYLGLPHVPLSPTTNAATQFLLTTLVVSLSWTFYSHGFRAAFLNFMPTMDSLIAIGTGAAYAYSTFVGAMIYMGRGGYGIDELYFETAALLLTFILLGKYLEAVAKGRTSDAIKKLMKLQPKTAFVVRQGKEREVPIEEVAVGDLVMVKPGQRIPVDGDVVRGESSVDESMITGESIPVAKTAGSSVIGGTINKTGSFAFKAKKIGSDTVLAHIIQLVEDAQASKAPIQNLADKISAYFVPAVVLVGIAAFVTWWLLGMGFTFALTTFIAVLIIACPCALGLATPTAVMVGTGKGAEMGILIKRAEALQTARELDAVIFDKTGTLTKGEPQVTDVYTLGRHEKKKVLQLAAMVEKNSEHPLAEAIVREAKTLDILIPQVSQFHAYAGKGVSGVYQRKQISLGTRRFMQELHVHTDFIENEMERLEHEGKTVMIVAVGGKIEGLIAVADTMKEHAREAVNRLYGMGLDVHMITGDNRRTADAIAREAGIKSVMSEVLPGDKANEVKRLQQEERKKVAFVGDGINDAPALTQADVGIALGSGTDVAMESGEIVLVKDDLRDVVRAIELSRYSITKIKQNLFWAFAYNIIGIPVAAGALYPLTGWLLSPIIAGAAMAFSSVSVVGNALLMKRKEI